MINFSRSSLYKVILSVSTVLVLVGCAADGPAHDATVTKSDESAGSAAGYEIGPGDSLQIFVWGHEDLSTSVEVRPDGRISTPLVEDLQAAGRTPTQLARDIEVVLKEYVRTPVVTVSMQGFVGEGGQQVRVIG